MEKKVVDKLGEETLKTWLNKAQNNIYSPFWNWNGHRSESVMCAIGHMLSKVVDDAVKLNGTEHCRIGMNTVLVTTKGDDHMRPDAKIKVPEPGDGASELSSDLDTDLECLVNLATQLIVVKYGTLVPKEFREYVENVQKPRVEHFKAALNKLTT